MARQRAKLTEKQERILVQCQLMGMTTADMVKISNRLRALDAEREFSVKVNEVTANKTWTKISTGHYCVTDSKGLQYDCLLTRNNRDRWSATSESWTVKVTHPGTRMKERVYKDQPSYSDYDETARICPDGDKKLYRLLKMINNGRFNK
jgi:hypothetical protein